MLIVDLMRTSLPTDIGRSHLEEWFASDNDVDRVIAAMQTFFDESATTDALPARHEGLNSSTHP